MDDICSICCAEIINKNEDQYKLPFCEHIYHINCFALLILHDYNKNIFVCKCPLCRTEFNIFNDVDLQKLKLNDKIIKRNCINIDTRRINSEYFDNENYNRMAYNTKISCFVICSIFMIVLFLIGVSLMCNKCDF